MKDLRIEAIVEAFSMQPRTMYIGMEVNGSKVAKIVDEDVFIVGDPFPYYVGYSSEGKRLFEFKKGTVNVIYCDHEL